MKYWGLNCWELNCRGLNCRPSFQTYHTNTDDILNKHSLTRIVGYGLKKKVKVKSGNSWSPKWNLAHTSAPHQLLPPN